MVLLSGGGFFSGGFHRQLQTAAVVGFQNLDAHLLAFFQIVGNGVDTLVGDLRDVQQAILAWHDLHDGAKVQQFQHGAFVGLAHFDRCRQLFDAALGFLAGSSIDGSDGDHAFVADVDLGTGFFGQRADHGAAFADHVTDFFRVDLDGDQTRCEIGQFGFDVRHGFLHFAQDVLAAFLGLRQRHLHDFLGDAHDLDIHLQRGDTVAGTSYLEVHVAQVIFVAQDVGQYGKLAAFLDQAHGDTGHVFFHRHAGVHQCQAAAAYRRHRRGTVRFGDFRYQAYRVAELFSSWQGGDQRALGQAAVADFAAFRRTDTARFAGGERRHVVMQHERIGELAHQCIDLLAVTGSTQGRHHQRLRFAAREQSGTVGAWQHAGTDRDRTHGARVAAVDAWLAVQDLRTDDFRFDVEQDVVHFSAVDRRAAVGSNFSRQVGDHFRRRRFQLGRTLLLVLGLIRIIDLGVGEMRDAGDQCFVFRRRRPFHFRLAAVTHQVVNRVDDDFHLVVAKYHGAQHDFFGQLFRFRFHHQHGRFGTGDNQVHFRGFQLLDGRVQDVLAVGVADAGGADRAVERHAGDAQRGGGADHGGDVRIDLRVDRQHVDDDLDFVQVAFREQRTDRTVDQTRGQRFFFRRTAFALEETARDFTGSIGFFDVIDGQREEVLAWLGVFARHNRCQHDRIFDRDQHGAGSLTGDFTGFQRHLMLTVLEGFRNFIKHG